MNLIKRINLLHLPWSIFFFIPFFLTAQTPDTTVLTIKKSKDFVVTGDGSSSNWNLAGWSILPKRNATEVSYQTKLKLLYSDSGIYCLYHCEDNMITATLKEDFADLYKEDVVEAFFWTDEKQPLYFEYELSPLNYELAILVPNNKGTFFGWRPWHYEGDRRTRHATKTIKKGETTTSWIAEFFIPFKLLRGMTNVPAQPGSRWRANFYRIDYDKKTSYWSWQLTRTNFHDYERFGTIVFE